MGDHARATKEAIQKTLHLVVIYPKIHDLIFREAHLGGLPGHHPLVKETVSQQLADPGGDLVAPSSVLTGNGYDRQCTSSFCSRTSRTLEVVYLIRVDPFFMPPTCEDRKDFLKNSWRPLRLLEVLRYDR